MKKLYLLFCLPLLFPSCADKKTGGDTAAEEVFTVNLQGDYPVKEVVLQDVAEVEYIPLETTDSSLVSMISYYMDDRYIIGVNKMGDIILFNRDGTFYHSFNHKGDGSKEYKKTPYNLCPDFSNQEIYVCDYLGSQRSLIQVYGFDGTYRRTLSIGIPQYAINLFDYDSNTLFLQDDNWLDKDLKDYTYNKTPFYKVSKQDGRMDSLPIRMEERMGSSFRIKVKVGDEWGSASTSFPSRTISKMGNRIVLSDFAQDTVYTYESDRLSPFLVKKNRLKGENTLMLNVEFMSGRYVCMCVQEKTATFDGKRFSAPAPSYLWYDRKDNSLSQVKFTNADGVSPEASAKLGSNVLCAYDYLLPANCAMQIYPVSFLQALNEEGKLKGRLKEIASNLKEEDNPVLMLVKFKE